MALHIDIQIIILIISFLTLIFTIIQYRLSVKQIKLSKKSINKELLDNFESTFDYLLERIDEARKNNYEKARILPNASLDEWQESFINDCNKMALFDKELSNDLMKLYNIDFTTDLFEYEDFIKNLKIRVDNYYVHTK